MLHLLSQVGARHAPIGCSPRDSGRLLSSRVGSFPDDFFLHICRANAYLWDQLSQSALRAKEAECAALAQERNRLAKKLADQEESHKVALTVAQDSEAGLKAEYETEAANWAEARQALSQGYCRVEDLIDGRPPSSLFLYLPPAIWFVF